MERYQKTTRNFMTSYRGDDMGRKYREYTYDDWKKAMDLHNKYKLGYRRISRMLGISQYTVRNWLHYGKIPPTAKWRAEPSKELSYIIGVVQGDACVSKSKSWYRYRIDLAVIDKEFAIIFSKILSRILDVNYHEPRWSKRRKRWCVEYRSKSFYEWYKKTKREGLEGFKPYIEHDIETVRHYLKGLFDSEGSNYRCKRISLYNTKKKLLEYVQYLLEKYFDIKSTGPYLVHKAGDITIINGIVSRYNNDYYVIDIGRKQYIQRFLREIGFSIARKQLGLKKYETVLAEGIGYI